MRSKMVPDGVQTGCEKGCREREQNLKGRRLNAPSPPPRLAFPTPAPALAEKASSEAHSEWVIYSSQSVFEGRFGMRNRGDTAYVEFISSWKRFCVSLDIRGKERYQMKATHLFPWWRWQQILEMTSQRVSGVDAPPKHRWMMYCAGMVMD